MNAFFVAKSLCRGEQDRKWQFLCLRQPNSLTQASPRECFARVYLFVLKWANNDWMISVPGQVGECQRLVGVLCMHTDESCARGSVENSLNSRLQINARS